MLRDLLRLSVFRALAWSQGCFLPTRAIRLRAKSIVPPEDQAYDERQAGFIDPEGNTWWVSTYKQMR
jgi:hypothetical protein